MKKKILASVFSIILSLFLACSLLAGSIGIFFQNTVCDSQKLQQIGKESGYTKELYDQIRASWENLLAITGVQEPDPILAILTPSLVEEDSLLYLSDSFTGKATLSTEELKADLDGKIRDYVRSQGEEDFDEELEKNIQELVSACIKKYESGIRIPLLPKILGGVSKIQKYLKPLIIASFGFSFVLLVFLFFLQQKKKNVLYYSAISTATGAILLWGASFFSDLYKLSDRLPLEKSALRTLLVSYVQNLIDALGQAGVIFFFVFLFCVALLLIFFVIETVLGAKKKAEPVSEEKKEEAETQEG